MCGIIGIASPIPATDRTWLTVGRDAMTHRGPDDAGEWWSADGCVGFGQRRLAIIDLSPAGHQPMRDASGELSIVFNGEIYNFADLRCELAAQGHVFRSQSDTEVLLAAYREWGTDCLSRLNGMFAFALYDRNRDTFFMARDRLAVKPMFYALLPDGTLAFGSELKVLMQHPALDRRIDPLAVEEYFALGYVAEPRTIFLGAKKLGPGESLCIRRGQPIPEPRQYWDVRFTLDNDISRMLRWIAGGVTVP